MDAVLMGQILDALKTGDMPKLMFDVGILMFIWIEVRGLKKGVEKLNSTVAKGFHEGETRFEKIEENQKQFEHRLTVIES